GDVEEVGEDGFGCGPASGAAAADERAGPVGCVDEEPVPLVGGAGEWVVLGEGLEADGGREVRAGAVGAGNEAEDAPARGGALHARRVEADERVAVDGGRIDVFTEGLAGKDGELVGGVGGVEVGGR